MSNPRMDLPILVVDDDALVRDVVVEYLKDMGFVNITEAKSAQQALKLIQSPSFDVELVLSDWEMPEVSGLTLLKAIRQHPDRFALRFVMITSQRSMERFKITQAAQWQVSAYIVKPFRADLLRKKIWDVMGWEDDEGEEQAS